MESLTKMNNGYANQLQSLQTEIGYFDNIEKTKKTKPFYSIILVTVNDRNTVVEFLRRFFLRDEPLNEAIRLWEEKDSEKKIENYCTGYLRDGMTFMALSQTGDVMGFIINSIMHRGDVEEEEDDNDENCNANSKFKTIVTLLDKIKREANVFGQYPDVNRIMEIKIVTVNDAYRGQGVCKALVDKTKELALAMGYQMIYVECTSHYSAKAVERFGFKCIYSLDYVDHVNEQGEMMFKTQFPHKRAKVYVLPL